MPSRYAAHLKLTVLHVNYTFKEWKTEALCTEQSSTWMADLTKCFNIHEIVSVPDLPEQVCPSYSLGSPSNHQPQQDADKNCKGLLSCAVGGGSPNLPIFLEGMGWWHRKCGRPETLHLAGSPLVYYLPFLTGLPSGPPWNPTSCCFASFCLSPLEIVI